MNRTHNSLIFIIISVSSTFALLCETINKSESNQQPTKKITSKIALNQKNAGFFNSFLQKYKANNQPAQKQIIPVINKDQEKYLTSFYNEWTFLTAHNAHTNKKFGWWYRQQNLGITQLLNYGVRGLMLDVHYYKNNIYLCHGTCSTIATVAQKSFINGIKSWLGFNADYQTLSNALQEIKKWMQRQNNKNEIVTIFLENYVDDALIEKDLKSIKSTAFTPLDLRNFRSHNTSQWPTIQELCIMDKRIIVFNEKKSGKIIVNTQYQPIFFNSFDHIIESQFGTTFNEDNKIDPNKICLQREESQKNNTMERSLYTFNFFSYPSKESDAYINNSFNNLMSAITACSKKNDAANKDLYVCTNKKPNFLALDFVDIGDGKRTVEYLNTITIDQLNQWKPESTSSEKLSIWARGFNQIVNSYKNIFKK